MAYRIPKPDKNSLFTRLMSFVQLSRTSYLIYLKKEALLIRCIKRAFDDKLKGIWCYLAVSKYQLF